MPRIRNIKPEFWDSPSTARADLAVRLTFIALWNWSDDSGHGTANLKELEAFCFPNDDVRDLPRRTSGDSSRNSGAVWPNFAEVLHEVAEAYGVVFYTVRGRNYYEIPSFKDHQAKHFRPQSKHPSSDEGQKLDIRSGNIVEWDDEDRGVPEVRLQDAELRPGSAEKGLLDRDREGDGDAEPPPQNLDELAAAHAARTRCPKHRHIPDGEWVDEPCRECQKLREGTEAEDARAAEAEKEARRHAIDNCDLCDDNGMRYEAGEAWRCDHQTETGPNHGPAAPQTDEQHARAQSPQTTTQTRQKRKQAPF